MGKPMNPGPPLTPADEFCECEPPSRMEYLKATGVAVLTVGGGAVGWFGMAAITQQLWAFTTVLVGMAAGWFIHRAAGRHRSVALGIIAAGATVMAATVGYALLWMPFVRRPNGGWPLSWYDLIMAGLAGFVAYRLAGPTAKAKHHL